MVSKQGAKKMFAMKSFSIYSLVRLGFFDSRKCVLPCSKQDCDGWNHVRDYESLSGPRT